MNVAGDRSLTRDSGSRVSPPPGTASFPPEGAVGRDGIADQLLGVPLFYKILIANAAILGLVVLLGGLLAARVGSGLGADEALRTGLLLVAAALVIGATCSAWLTRLALRPLHELEETAKCVEIGDLETRAALSLLADADMRRLVTVFNRMLDRVEWYRSRQRELIVRSLESEERARRWVARRLYDECAQSIAAVLLRLRAAGLRLGDGEGGELEQLRVALLEALESVRQVARELRPPELDEIGLVAALAAQVRTLSERSGVEIRLDADPVEPDLSTDAGLALYRIAHEALANAVRHADAHSVEVRISRLPDGVAAEVRDDGKGFDVDTEIERAGRGLGLLEMRERALYVGAALSIESLPGEGTRIEVLVPLPQREVRSRRGGPSGSQPTEKQLNTGSGGGIVDIAVTGVVGDNS